MFRCLAVVSLATLLLPVQGCQGSASAEPPVRVPTVVNEFPHDTEAFTQGLVFADGVLYESTGLTGKSELRRVDLTTGRVLRRRPLPPTDFGEGLTAFDTRLVQLTWQSGTGYVYDRDDFELTKVFRYDGEGWGLTQDGESLIMSDGSATLRFLDPQTYAVRRRLTVTAGGTPVRRLNELEYVNGVILANVFTDERIARIDPRSGEVTAWYDLSDLADSVPGDPTQDVLNGIAYDDRTGRLFVTGKRWPHIFQVKLPD